MKFSIITPTYRRAEKLRRAVHSLQSQTYQDWEMIIVNDSPDDPSYATFASSINDARIHYHVQDRNRGVNHARNLALDKVSVGSKWVIFLDDDDYLPPDALKTFYDLTLLHPTCSWFLTNRALPSGVSLTEAKEDDRSYSYAWHYLFKRGITGDATHCVSTQKLHGIRFLTNVKQGEEWFFFYQLGLTEKPFYHNHNSTISDGYQKDGLNFRKRSRGEQLETLSIIFYEGIRAGIAYRPSFFLYLSLKFLRCLIKN